MSDEPKKSTAPWPMFPARNGESVGKGLERTMFGKVGADDWSPRTVIQKTPEGETRMKAGGGMVSFRFTPNKAVGPTVDSGLWPLTERDYEERTYFAERATMTELHAGTVLYAPVASFIMLDVEGREVQFILKDAP